MKKSAAARQAKDLLIWMHVLTSVGWGIMASAQLALLAHGLTSDRTDQVAIFQVALFLENNMLDPFAIIAAFTGMMLSAMTPWGYFRHWWVLVKFVLTWVLLLAAAIFISEWLPAAIEAAKVGQPGPMTPLLIGTISMIASVVLMTWISLVKPWGKRGDARGKRIDLNPGAWTFAAVLLVPVAEWAMRVDYPVMTLLTVITYSIFRGVRLRRLGRQAATAAPARTRARTGEATPVSSPTR